MNRKNLVLFHPTNQNLRSLKLVDTLRQLKIQNADVEVSTMPMMIDGLDINQIDLVLLDLEQWSNEAYIFLSALRERGYKGPSLVLHWVAPVNSSRPPMEEELAYFIEKPFEVPMILGLFERMLNREEAPTPPTPQAKATLRAEKRIAVNAPVAVMLEGQPEKKVRLLMTDISKSGAYLQLVEPLEVNIGDKAQMTVQLPETNHTYTFVGEIRRIGYSQVSSDERDKPQAQGFGVQFVSSWSLSSSPQAA